MSWIIRHGLKRGKGQYLLSDPRIDPWTGAVHSLPAVAGRWTPMQRDAQAYSSRSLALRVAAAVGGRVVKAPWRKGGMCT